MLLRCEPPPGTLLHRRDIPARQFQALQALKQAGGGPDGLSIREFDTSETPNCPAYSATLPSHFPLLMPLASVPGVKDARGNRLSARQRAEIAARAKQESLRQLAKEYRVSHETIRREIGRDIHQWDADSTCGAGSTGVEGPG
jgi:hypothetical protein